MTIETPVRGAQRTYASQQNLSLFGGLLNVQVDLVPVKHGTPEAKFTTICPTCPTPTQLNQRYLCPEDDDHGPFSRDEAHRAQQIGSGKNQTLARVSDEEIEAMKAADLPEGEMAVHVYPLDSISAATRPSGTAYRLRPPKKAGPSQLSMYHLIYDLLSNDGKAFVGELTLRGNQKLFRMEQWRNQIVLQELVRPDDVGEPDEIESAEYDGRLLATAQTLLDQQVEDFNPDSFRNLVNERARELKAAKEKDPNAVATEIIERVEAPAINDTDSLLAALEASVKITKTKAKK